MDIVEVRKFCTETFLVPFESYATRLPDGSCEAYPDPASPMGMAGYVRWTFGTEFTPEDGAPWTIGFGSTFDDTGRPVKPGEMWSYDKAVYVKGVVTNRFLQSLITMSPGLITEPVPRIAAVLSWVYNCGLGAYRISTYKKRIDAKDWIGAAEEGKKWDKAQGKKMKGLTRRRALEAVYIISG